MSDDPFDDDWYKIAVGFKLVVLTSALCDSGLQITARQLDVISRRTQQPPSPNIEPDRRQLFSEIVHSLVKSGLLMIADHPRDAIWEIVDQVRAKRVATRLEREWANLQTAE